MSFVLSNLLIPILSILLGIYSFQYMNKSYRLAFFQLLLYLMVLLICKQLLAYQKENGLERNTMGVYNIYLPAESLILMFCAHSLFSNKILKQLAISSMVLFSLIYLVELYIKDRGAYCLRSDLTANLCLLLLFGLVLYFEFQASMDWYNSPAVWISIGILLYSVCTMPYMSFFEYLNSNHANRHSFFFKLINLILGNIRYIFYGLAFWLVRRNHFYQAKVS